MTPEVAAAMRDHLRALVGGSGAACE